jgi:oligoribonuclease NrnB/cAMP/cGMP phosphodiesterase (DHH superfamily)
MKENLKDIVIIYHDHCQDGFGAAFAAWKKFGDSASYIPCSDRKNPPEGLVNKEVYILDFSYPAEVLLSLESVNKKLVIIDHHISAKEAVMGVKEHLFCSERSGAYLSWQYFVSSNVPHFIELLDIIDLAKDKTDSFNDETTYILSKPYSFEAYEELCSDFSDNTKLSEIKKLGAAQNQYLKNIIQTLTEDPSFVEFEGYTVPCLNVYLPINEKSLLLKELYTKYPPFAISYRLDDGKIKASLRSDGITFDVSELAAKYGGGGHKGAAGFVVESDLFPPMFKPVKERGSN